MGQRGWPLTYSEAACLSYRSYHALQTYVRVNAYKSPAPNQWAKVWFKYTDLQTGKVFDSGWHQWQRITNLPATFTDTPSIPMGRNYRITVYLQYWDVQDGYSNVLTDDNVLVTNAGHASLDGAIYNVSNGNGHCYT
jgi:hypothetical protein